jgi:hypothetical protein
MTDERALKIALMSLHEKRQRGENLQQVNEAIVILERLHNIAKRASLA